jgi:hypothetical protein
MSLADHVTLNLNNMTTAAVLVYIEKAFGTTWHSGLLHKLYELEFSVSLIKLIASFLADRKCKVLLEGKYEVFNAKKNSGRGAPSFRPCSYIVQSINKRCPCGTWN